MPLLSWDAHRALPLPLPPLPLSSFPFPFDLDLSLPLPGPLELAAFPPPFCHGGEGVSLVVRPPPDQTGSVPRCLCLLLFWIWRTHLPLPVPLGVRVRGRRGLPGQCPCVQTPM